MVNGVKMNVVVGLVKMMALLLLVHGSTAQTTTTHVVGEDLGWIVPPGGPDVYSLWASSQTFSLGDVLVFNFMTDAHNVAEVTRSDYEGCNSTNNPISISTTGPTNITLNTTGDHYFICTVGIHCDLGQKLFLNVSSSSSAPSPSPAAADGAETFVVGDKMGWTIPPGGPFAYQAWASDKTFIVGDTLEFNFLNGTHTVAEVTKEAYETCNTTAAANPITTGPAKITLATAGEHFFICTIPMHCSLGQQLAINVTATAASPPSSIADSPSSTASPPSSIAGPPSTTALPPSSIAGPPSTITPSSPSPSDGAAPPQPNNDNSSSSIVVSGLWITLLSIAIASLYN